MEQGKLAVFHPGTQHSWQTARALMELGRLEFYATSIFYQSDRLPYRLERIPGPMGRRLRREFRRFRFDALDPSFVRTGGFHEWLERAATRAGLSGLSRWIDKRGNAAFANLLKKEIENGEGIGLWGYNNSALEAFRLGNSNGRTCILDQTIGGGRSFNRAMDEIQDRYGDWFLREERRIPDAAIDRNEEEWALADRILVGCDFAAGTIRTDSTDAAVAEKIRVLEYCFDEALFGALPAPRPSKKGQPVRFLFLGSAIPRKGIHHVLEAMEQFSASEAELTIVGQFALPEPILAKYGDRFRHIENVPRADVPGIMARHDVLLFPTYYEGAGLVLYEALASGLALIQSDRAALAVTDDTGILLQCPDTDLLVEAMRNAILDRNQLNHWKASAQQNAQQFAFKGYRQRIASLLNGLEI